MLVKEVKVSFWSSTQGSHSMAIKKITSKATKQTVTEFRTQSRRWVGGKKKICVNDPRHMPWSKPLKTFSEPVDQWSWNVVCSIRHWSTIIRSAMGKILRTVFFFKILVKTFAIRVAWMSNCTFASIIGQDISLNFDPELSKHQTLKHLLKI